MLRYEERLSHSQQRSVLELDRYGRKIERVAVANSTCRVFHWSTVLDLGQYIVLMLLMRKNGGEPEGYSALSRLSDFAPRRRWNRQSPANSGGERSVSARVPVRERRPRFA